MKRRLILCLTALIWLCLNLNASLPAAYTAKGNPALYDQLRSMARQNLTLLDKPARTAYQDLLRQYDDVLMNYLIAYEADAVLQMARPADVESNYLQIRELMDSKRFDLSPEFFLSYVARQTVSDERVQAYRKAFLDDGLRDLMKRFPDEVELYREVSKWCLERLTFQPTSGRDQSPLDITRSSYLGRCEEMQILFVAAARTVGLPARPASTPWWAHTDNNHAWAEVWLEGAWHYTGDMDAAYYPDQTWFSGMIDKTVLILADGSLASESDEVLSSGRYDKTINSTPNYAKERTRRLSIEVRDDRGNPASGALLGVLVYNWGALRPLTFVQAGKDGRFTISVGRGAFFVSAFKDGKSALGAVHSSEESEMSLSLVISERDLLSQNQLLAYPSNPFEWKQAPQGWNDDVTNIKKRIAERERLLKNRAIPAIWEPYDSLFWQVASACRGNQIEFQLFASRHRPVDADFLSFLLNDDPKLLWQMDAGQFEAMYHFFRQHANSQLSEEALHSLISPSVYFEELPRPFYSKKTGYTLYPAEFIQKGSTTLEKLNRISKWMNKRYNVAPDKALAGLLPVSVAALQKHLTPIQKRIMAVNVARANGIPADFTRLPNVISVMLDGDWAYYDIQKGQLWKGGNDGETSESGLWVQTVDEDGFALDIDPSQLVLTRWEDGMFYSLNYRFTPQGKGQYMARIPQGSYYLQMGYRVSDTFTGFLMDSVKTGDRDSLSVTLIASSYPRTWKALEPEIATLLEPVLREGYELILLGSHDHENSLRLAEKIRAAGKDFLWLGHSPADAPPANYRVLDTWSELVKTDQRNAVRVITVIKKDGLWQMHEGLWDKLP